MQCVECSIYIRVQYATTYKVVVIFVPLKCATILRLLLLYPKLYVSSLFHGCSILQDNKNYTLKPQTFETINHHPSPLEFDILKLWPTKPVPVSFIKIMNENICPFYFRQYFPMLQPIPANPGPINIYQLSLRILSLYLTTKLALSKCVYGRLTCQVNHDFMR